jgi:hypothetical protein
MEHVRCVFQSNSSSPGAKLKSGMAHTEDRNSTLPPSPSHPCTQVIHYKQGQYDLHDERECCAKCGVLFRRVRLHNAKKAELKARERVLLPPEL